MITALILFGLFCWICHLIGEWNDNRLLTNKCKKDPLIMAYNSVDDENDIVDLGHLISLYQIKAEAGCGWSSQMLNAVENDIQSKQNQHIISDTDKILSNIK